MATPDDPNRPAEPPAGGEHWTPTEAAEIADRADRAAEAAAEEAAPAGTPDRAEAAALLAEGRDGSGRPTGIVDYAVAAPALTVILAIAIWAIGWPASFDRISTAAFQWLITDLGWIFVLAASLFFFAMVGLAISRHGHIKLGRDDEKPEFSTPSWVAMMFAAGMGIGLLFYGPYEPLSHYLNGVPEHRPREVGTAFATTMLHFGPVAWATYAVVGCAIAYGTFRLGRPQLISAACIPLIGPRRARGLLGKLIDIAAIFATVFGTAMSLGLGSAQISAGLAAVGWIDAPTITSMLWVIAVLSIGYLASAMSGVARGVQWLSNLNMSMAGLLLVFLLIAGPTVAILNLLPLSVGSFFDQLPEMLSRTAGDDDGRAGQWLSNWTIFYWVWWVSWTPFVGMFLARISRGRTIREFVGGIVLVPSVLTLLWFAVFGGNAITLEREGRSIWGDGTPEKMLFAMLDRLPLTGVSSVLAIVLLGTFFITTADSASTVMGTMSQRGRVNPTPWVTGVWGLMTTLIAVAILLSGGTDVMDSLQVIIIVAGSPFLFVVVALLVSLWRGVTTDPAHLEDRKARFAYARLAREQRIRARRGEGGMDAAAKSITRDRVIPEPEDNPGPAPAKPPIR
ncbi:BCCT family transporter [Corynebacterium sphenisci]|uniref:BCCT family transporter n=1 Tax=Corynebacterium sphenisci TaxID=191493 RepID=UPI0026E0672D|nr:BCCT family transporter [Corynebacterium sphenisci]MDO5732044.1 BCCT family transporter [Corynebacterium sphenisci]